MAPEVYKDEIFNRNVDAYSFGLILYEVLFFSQTCLCSKMLNRLSCLNTYNSFKFSS